MISRKTAEEIHTTLIKRFGGIHGIRDTQALDSALLRPFKFLITLTFIQTQFTKPPQLLKASLQIILSLMEIKEQVMY